MEVKLTIQTENMVVLDDVLTKEHFKAMWQYTETEQYAIPHVQNWIKVWRLGDNLPMGGPEYVRGPNNNEPFGNAMDLMVAYTMEIAKLYPKYMGEDYDEAVFRSYLYPRNTKLSWHDDSIYKSAMVFYTHRRWNNSWGGELMVEETPESGVGIFVQAKPNRLVLTRAPILHQINRVDADAGENVRSSIVAFFRKSQSA